MGAARASGDQRLCSTFLSTGTVREITGLGTKPYGIGVIPYPARDGVPDGDDAGGQRIPGSVCQWIDTTDPVGGLTNTAQLLVGYGASQAGWNELVSYFKAGAPGGYPIGFTDKPKYSVLHLRPGIKAFLTTVNLGKYYGYTAGEYPGIKTHLYAVTVLTKLHNILQVWFVNTSAAKTEAWATHIVDTDQSFF
jgi:hypothetical protein